MLQSGKASCSTSNLPPSDWGKVAIASFPNQGGAFTRKLLLFVKVRRKHNLFCHDFCKVAVSWHVPSVCLNSVPCSLISHTQSTDGVDLWDFFVAE